MAIENSKLMHECFPKHYCIKTARMKKDKDSEKEGKKRYVSMESQVGMKNKRFK